MHACHGTQEREGIEKEESKPNNPYDKEKDSTIDTVNRGKTPNFILERAILTMGLPNNGHTTFELDERDGGRESS